VLPVVLSGKLVCYRAAASREQSSSSPVGSSGQPQTQHHIGGRPEPRAPDGGTGGRPAAGGRRAAWRRTGRGRWVPTTSRGLAIGMPSIQN